MRFISLILAVLNYGQLCFAGDARPVTLTKITGSSETIDVDTVTAGGANRLQTNAAQSGTWTTGRTWTLLNSTDSVNSVQSGTWTTGRTWTLLNSTDSVNAVQSGTWTTGRTWTLSNGTDSIAAVQSGTWNINNITGTVSLPTGASTAALQTTGNSSLSSIDGKLNSLGQKAMTGSVPVVVASDQSAIPVTQSGAWTTGRTWTLSSGTDSIAAVQSGTWTVQQGATPTAVANAWPFKLTDGTNTTAVKSASTAPLATDPAAVVVQSPNGNHATAANQQTEITALQIIDNLPHSNDSTLNQGVPVMGQLDDTSTGTVTENNVSTVRITSARGLHTNLRNASGTEIATPTTPARMTPQYQGSKLRFDDMNVATGGVARGTTISSTSVFTTVYNYSGTGELFSFLIALQGNLPAADSFTIKLEMDGVTVFSVETSDLGTATIYGLSDLFDESSMGLSVQNNVVRFLAPLHSGLYYSSSVKVSIKKSASATGKLFNAGAVYLTKES